MGGVCGGKGQCGLLVVVFLQVTVSPSHLITLSGRCVPHFMWNMRCNNMRLCATFYFPSTSQRHIINICGLYPLFRYTTLQFRRAS
jgi:hypothetical protein